MSQTLSKVISSSSSFLTVVGALTLLLAGSYIGLFNDLTFDDIARKVAGHRSIVDGAKAFYFGETGRFTNGLLTQHAGLYELSVYRYLHLVNAFIWVSSLLFFVISFCRYEKVQERWFVTLLLSSSIIISMIANAPNLGEWWFWYATASLYMFGSSLLLVGFGFVLQALHTQKPYYWLLASFFLFFAAGCSEMIMLICIASSGIIFLICFIRARNRQASLPFLFSLIAGALVVFSPGTSARLEMISGQGVFTQIMTQWSDLPLGIYLTALDTIQFWFRDSFAPLISFIGLLSGLLTGRHDHCNWRLLLLLITQLITILVTLCVLVVLMDWKININDTSRTSNLAYFLFLLLWQLICFSVGQYFARWVATSNKFLFVNTFLLGAIFLLLIAGYKSYNFSVMHDDIRFDRPSRQQISIAGWDAVILKAKKNKQQEIVVPNMISANTLTVYRYGPALDPNYPINNYWKQYKGLSKQSFSRRNFDRALLRSVHDQYRPIEDGYNLQTYSDRYRSYLIVQIRKGTRSQNPFCVALQPLVQRSYSDRLRDENYPKLQFNWKNNELCRRFGARKLYCEPYKLDWMCRIPIPLAFRGELMTSWGSLKKSISL